MRLLVTALLKSIPALINVVVFLTFIFFIFGIVGVQLWAGILHSRCRFTEGPVQLVGGGVGSFETGCRDPDSSACLSRILKVDVNDIPRLTDTVYSPSLGMYVSDIVNTSAIERCNGPPANATWHNTYDCFWPIDLTDTFVCSLGSSGNHQCALGRWCGSHFDSEGNKRFSNEQTQQMGTFIPDLNFGYTRFDNILLAFVTIFQSITMEGWTDVMYQLQDSFNAFVAAIYFVVLILFGSFFLLNLTLAVIWDRFSTEQMEEKAKKEVQRAEKDVEDKTKAVRKLERDIQAAAALHDDSHTPRTQEGGAGRSGSVVVDRTLVRPGSAAGDENGVRRSSSSMINHSGTSGAAGRRSVTGALSQPASRSVNGSGSVPSTSSGGGRRTVPLEVRSRPASPDAEEGDRMHAANTAASHPSVQPEPTDKVSPLPPHESGSQGSGRVPTDGTSTVITANTTPQNAAGGGGDVSKPQGQLHESRLRNLASSMESLRELEEDAGCSMHSIVTSHSFRTFIIFLIVINTVILACDHYPMERSFSEPLDMMNFILTLLFTLEMAMKLIGLGIKGYVADAFNIFDALIVIISIVELAVAPPGFLTPEEGDVGGSGAISALRTFRLFRVFKLARSWKSLNVLLKTIVRTLQDIGNFAVLLVLFMYIFALVGMQFFANQFCFDDNTALPKHSISNVCPEAFERPRSHFDNLLWSFVTVFQVLTGTCTTPVAAAPNPPPGIPETSPPPVSCPAPECSAASNAAEWCACSSYPVLASDLRRDLCLFNHHTQVRTGIQSCTTVSVPPAGGRLCTSSRSWCWATSSC